MVQGATEATERVGFEPTEAFTSPVFKTGAINHSTTSPAVDPWGRKECLMTATPSAFSFKTHENAIQAWDGASWVVVAAMAVLSTNLLALRTRELADLIETLPVSLAPELHYERCCELLEQLAIALDLLADSR